jgi:hypothetical protein
LAHLPRRPLFGDVRAVLLGGADRLFLYVSFSSRNALLIAHGVTDTPRRSRSSASVASGFSFTSSARRGLSIFCPRDRAAVARDDVAAFPTMLLEPSHPRRADLEFLRRRLGSQPRVTVVQHTLAKIHRIRFHPSKRTRQKDVAL